MALSKKYLEMAINACLEKLADADPQVRAKAAKSLGELGSEEAIPFLCQFLEMQKSIYFDLHHYLTGLSC